MSKTVQAGSFYEFDRFSAFHEVGWTISHRGVAISRVRAGKDVYTLRRADAFDLAGSVFPGQPVEEGPREAAHFRHFHPGRRAEGLGHIFFDDRGG